MNVQSTWLSPRTYTECAYMWPEATIYCYGGDIQSMNTSCDNENKESKNNEAFPGSSASNDTHEDVDGCGENPAMIFYSLDLTQSKPLNELQNSWKLVGDGIGVDPNKHFTLSAITGNNQTKLIMYGGIGNETQPAYYAVGAYDTANKTWVEVEKYLLAPRS
ncbi:hypothetical protein INT45_014246 [Circinella minor]|uniref:Uncharacterized protein n=1 Tax=Circinella minor TaxID=1195481 RepID=A0A8H7SBY4_9FUNG|nr:hypothetical protein INT45_014246 [Circinella minor]